MLHADLYIHLTNIHNSCTVSTKSGVRRTILNMYRLNTHDSCYALTQSSAFNTTIDNLCKKNISKIHSSLLFQKHNIKKYKKKEMKNYYLNELQDIHFDLLISQMYY